MHHLYCFLSLFLKYLFSFFLAGGGLVLFFLWFLFVRVLFFCLITCGLVTILHLQLYTLTLKKG